MKRILVLSRRLLLTASLMGLLGIQWGFGQATSSEGPRVLVGEIRGTINPATDDYLEAAIQKAERDGAQALIMKLDTPGGLLTSTHTMAQSMDRSKVPVIFYVHPAGASATSAGALLMISSHVAAMTPGSHMGAAHPVDASGKDISGDMKAKAVNDTIAFAQSMAELRGRDRELSRGIVEKSLSYTAQEAFDKKLIEVLASNETELLQKLEGRSVTLRKGEARVLRTAGATIETVEMTLGQKLLHVLSNPNIAAILATLALFLIYVELQSPGIQIAGALGVIFLIISFMSFQTLPIRLGALALMALGMVLLVAELFVTSGGALAIGGVLSFILGMIWLVDPAQISQGVSAAVWVPAAIGLGLGALTLGWIASHLKGQIRKARERIKGGGEAGLQGYVARVQSLAGEGALMSPFGKILIRGELWDFVSEDPVRVGEEVRVQTVDGFKVKVQRIG